MVGGGRAAGVLICCYLSNLITVHASLDEAGGGVRAQEKTAHQYTHVATFGAESILDIN